MSGQSPRSQLETETVNLFLSALSNDCSRAVVDYFRTSAENVASLEELVEYVTNRQTRSGYDCPDRVAVRLHHSELPRLADVGVVDYDPRTNVVRYRDHPIVEENVFAAGMVETAE